MMHIKQIVIGTVVIFLVGTGAVYAQEVTPTPSGTQAATPSTSQKDQLKERLKQEREEVRTNAKNIRSTVKSMRGKAMHINGAIVKTASGSGLTITKDGKDYTVNASTSTIIRRKFWGKSTLSDIAVGHTVNVWGRWSDDAQTTIAARLIRDLSIQKRNGVFIGTVKSKDANSFVLSTRLRGDQMIQYDANTKFINRRGVSITATEISVGDRVRVKGLWDRVTNKVTQVTQVKDYSLPPRTATGTPSVTITTTPDVVVTSTPTP